jgi:hypothetical protein
MGPRAGLDTLLKTGDICPCENQTLVLQFVASYFRNSCPVRRRGMLSVCVILLFHCPLLRIQIRTKKF